MQKAAVIQAKGRLRRAMRALDQLANATELEPFEDAWSDFLIAAGGIYSKLKEGAKGHKTSGEWFARKVGERRKDPLLRYIHAARNADEHGLNLGAAYETTIEFSGIAAPELKEVDGQVRWVFTLPRASIHAKTIEPTLVAVTDTKHGDTFQPPDIHLGEPLDSLHPVRVAGLAVVYLLSLVDEADHLA